MKLSEIDRAVQLRNWRQKAKQLESIADSAIEVKFLYYPDARPESTISVQCVRDAIKDECRKMIGTWEYELKALGVEITEE